MLSYVIMDLWMYFILFLNNLINFTILIPKVMDEKAKKGCSMVEHNNANIHLFKQTVSTNALDS